MLLLDTREPLGREAVAAIHRGDVEALRRLLDERPDLATARLGSHPDHGCGKSRTLLHVATDWPGHFPNGAAAVAVLVGAGGRRRPLHRPPHRDAAALGRAQRRRRGAGRPARRRRRHRGARRRDRRRHAARRRHRVRTVEAARRLVERGARSTLWESAALGLIDRVEERFAGGDPPAADDVTHAFWAACHGGQQGTAELLVARRADRNWIGSDDLTPLEAARRSEAHELAAWLREVGAVSAGEAISP